MKQGDIFVSCWGATMAMVSFFRVLKTSASGNTATLAEIPAVETNTGFLHGTCVADVAAKDGKQITRRVLGNGTMKLEPSYGYIEPWDGRPMHYDHCD